MNKYNVLTPFGIEVKKALIECGLSQKEFCRQQGIVEVRFSEVLYGTRPGRELRKKVAETLGIPYEKEVSNLTHLKKYSPIRLQLIKAEFKAEFFKNLATDQDEEINDVENQIAAMQAKLEGLREINTVTRQELHNALADYTKYAKEFEKEKEGAGQAGQTL
jgi:transcriptional regulator with XRE-family HTH domain